MTTRIKLVVLALGSGAILLAASFPSQSLDPKAATTPRYQLVVAPKSRGGAPNLDDRPQAVFNDSELYRIDTWTGRVWRLSGRWQAIMERDEQ